jgi:hypothetical protein
VVNLKLFSNIIFIALVYTFCLSDIKCQNFVMVSNFLCCAVVGPVVAVLGAVVTIVLSVVAVIAVVDAVIDAVINALIF